MKDYAKINKKWWNAVAPIHLRSELYDLKSFKKGKSSLFSIEKMELGNVQGKSLLHLMSHIGMDTLSLAREGAVVPGVDFSDESIRIAKKLCKDLNTPADFICSDIYNLPKILHKKFDIVFTSYGILYWLKDIKKWAKIINHYLKKGGYFYIVELHPFTNILSCDFKFCYKYFDKGPDVDDSPGTYADWNAKVKGKTYIWSYTISDVINALIEEGFKIEYVHEFPFTMYNQLPGFMKKNKNGEYILKNKKIQIPLLFSLKATKTASNR